MGYSDSHGFGRGCVSLDERNQSKVINKHNKEYFKNLEEKLGNQYKLTYSNKMGSFSRDIKLKIEDDRYSYSIYLLGMDHDPYIDNKKFEQQLKVGNERDDFFMGFKSACERVFLADKLNQTLGKAEQKNIGIKPKLKI